MKNICFIIVLLLLLTLSANGQSNIFNAGGYVAYRVNSYPKSDFVDFGKGFRFNFFMPKDSKFSFGIYGDYLSYGISRDLEKHVETPSDYFYKTVGKYSSVSIGGGVNRLLKFGESHFMMSFGTNSGLNFTTRNSFSAYFLNEDGSTTTIEVYNQGPFKSIGFFVAPYADLIFQINNFGLHLGTTFSYRYSNFGSAFRSERLGEIYLTKTRESFHIVDLGIYFGFSLDIAEW